MATDKHDIVVFGATGFTGERICRYLYAQGLHERLRIAIAGRSRPRLLKVLPDVGDGRERVAVIVADVGDDESLRAMAAAARVVINAVGPYRFYGAAVVRAAVAAGCDYVDVTGEPEFMEKMVVEHQGAASDSIVVPACGFDSVPADMGVAFLQKKFAGTLNNIESYLHIDCTVSPAGHFATYESAVHGFANVKDLQALRKANKELLHRKIEYPGPKMRRLGNVWSNPAAKGRPTFVFPGSDASVVRRSQMACDTPTQYAAYAVASSKSTFVMLGVAGMLLGILSSFSFGRKLLLSFPSIFTFGVFSHKGPSQEQLDGTSFRMEFVAQGYDGAPSAGEKPTKVLKGCVRGPEPGYVATPIIVSQCALTLLDERAKIKQRGVLTTATAFRDTSLIERLDGAGIKFELM